MRIAIIGGGAAGFFAAITAKEMTATNEVFIFERLQKPLAKVAITGGGRCNLTNSFASVVSYKQTYPRGYKLIQRLFKEFNYNDTFKWFEQRGVPLVVQDDDCVFPQSQNAQSIIHCLLQEAQKLNIQIKLSHTLENLQKEANQWELSFKGMNQTYLFDAVIVTTGGGVKKEAFALWEKLGLPIVPPCPSLFSFNVVDKQLRELMGTVVDHASVFIPNTKFKATGALLITHWGMSGPAILKLSSQAAVWLKACNYCSTFSVNWINLNATEAEEYLHHFKATNGTKTLAKSIPFGITHRLWHFFLQKLTLNPNKPWNELSKKSFHQIINLCINDSYIIDGKSTYKKEFVTSGGISLKALCANTLESKEHEGLYFAGEVTDVDAITGGFNLQAAWTMGYVAGKNAALKNNT